MGLILSASKEKNGVTSVQRKKFALNNQLTITTYMNLRHIPIFTLVSASLISTTHAEELVSNVIHNYDQANVGFVFAGKPIVGSDADAFGFTSGVSSEISKDLLVSFNGGSMWGKDDTISVNGNLWSISPSVGWIFRLAGNQVNLIPHINYSYSEMSLAKYDGSSHGIAGGATFSLAKTDRAAFLFDYTYGDSISDDYTSFYSTGAHTLTVGPTVRVGEKTGVYLRGYLKWPAEDRVVVENKPFGIIVGLEYHW